MTASSSTQTDVTRLTAALDGIREQLPAMSNIVDAFEPVLIEEAKFRDEIVLPDGFQLPDIDPERFRQGAPVVDTDLFRVSHADIQHAAERLIPALKQGFPKIADKLVAVREAIRAGSFDASMFADAPSRADDRSVGTVAQNLGLHEPSLRFAIGALTGPFAEKRAHALTPLPEELQWLKGYCPLCGSWPSLSYLQGEEGQRWLRCSFCAHEYRFIRTACPFCENEDHEKLEMLYAEDRPFERVEICHECKRYIVSVDIREMAEKPVMEAVPLGLVYLDLLAQDKGFTPGGATPWNSLTID
jgi:FdhE protein